MKRPWQIWFLFLLCLTIVVPAMVWLSRLALTLEYEQRLARSRAELEEVVGNVLWQTDAALTRIIAPETARPYYMYRPIWALPRNDDQTAITPSPLLMQPSEFVRLHFQIGPTGTWSSPQCPEGDEKEVVLRLGVPAAQLNNSQHHLNELQRVLSRHEIMTHLPAPPMSLEGQTAATADLRGDFDSQVVMNRSVDDWLRATENAAQQPEKSIAGGKGDYAVQLNQSAQQLRGGGNLRQRNENFQQQARQASTEQNLSYNPVDSSRLPLQVAEGPTEIFWHKGRLLSARHTIIDGRSYVQGCWFNWEQLYEHVIKDSLDVLPSARVEPFVSGRTAGPQRVLAVVPARLVVPEPVVSRSPFSPIHWAVLVAWSLLALAAISTAALLHGVVALSERRASFVSAVTHELRTPLTTFRLYSEMLAEGMVSEERRRMYLETLQREAERLSHLVENVLQYARLERGAARRRQETISLATLAQRIEPALARRAQQADMKLEIDLPANVQQQQLQTDVGAVEQILFNLVDNSCKYAAASEDRRIHWEITSDRNRIVFTVRDHGPGIAAREARRLFHPFHKSAEQAAESAPGVGLGLALCRRLAKQIGARLVWQPSPSGAAFRLWLPLENGKH